MEKNIGKKDRIVRTVAALALAVLVFANVLVGIPAYLALGLGAILALTSSMSWCPLYMPFGIKTCGKDCCRRSDTGDNGIHRQ